MNWVHGILLMEKIAHIAAARAHIPWQLAQSSLHRSLIYYKWVIDTSCMRVPFTWYKMCCCRHPYIWDKEFFHFIRLLLLLCISLFQQSKHSEMSACMYVCMHVCVCVFALWSEEKIVWFLTCFTFSHSHNVVKIPIWWLLLLHWKWILQTNVFFY